MAIGRAIVHDPEVFLFDEPLSNLDAALRVQTRLEIAQLHERLKIRTIYFTHDQVEAMTLAGKIFVLRDGRISKRLVHPSNCLSGPQSRLRRNSSGAPR